MIISHHNRPLGYTMVTIAKTAWRSSSSVRYRREVVKRHMVDGGCRDNQRDDRHERYPRHHQEVRPSRPPSAGGVRARAVRHCGSDSRRRRLSPRRRTLVASARIVPLLGAPGRRGALHIPDIPARGARRRRDRIGPRPRRSGPRVRRADGDREHHPHYRPAGARRPRRRPRHRPGSFGGRLRRHAPRARPRRRGSTAARSGP